MAKNREPKQYAVEVVQKHQHGRYGKDFYFGMYLYGLNKKDAEEVGMEELAQMSFKEIDERCVDSKMKPWHIWTKDEHERTNGVDAPIGFENAEKFFACRAYIEK